MCAAVAKTRPQRGREGTSPGSIACRQAAAAAQQIGCGHCPLEAPGGRRTLPLPVRRRKEAERDAFGNEVPRRETHGFGKEFRLLRKETAEPPPG